MKYFYLIISIFLLFQVPVHAANSRICSATAELVLPVEPAEERGNILYVLFENAAFPWLAFCGFSAALMSLVFLALEIYFRGFFWLFAALMAVLAFILAGLALKRASGRKWSAAAIVLGVVGIVGALMLLAAS